MIIISFNPRAHTGRDISILGYNAAVIVSIHAPTRGAIIRVLLYKGVIGFNPRAHTGRDEFGSTPNVDDWFQSTRPHGAR